MCNCMASLNYFSAALIPFGALCAAIGLYGLIFTDASTVKYSLLHYLATLAGDK